MSVPDYLVCLNCETPCYVFEWADAGTITEALCQVCGNDELDEFATPEDFEEMTSDTRTRRAVHDPRFGPSAPDPRGKGPQSKGH